MIGRGGVERGRLLYALIPMHERRQQQPKRQYDQHGRNGAGEKAQRRASGHDEALSQGGFRHIPEHQRQHERTREESSFRKA